MVRPTNLNEASQADTQIELSLLDKFVYVPYFCKPLLMVLPHQMAALA